MKKINLGKLKYIIPTIAMPFVMSGCGKPIPKSGVVVAKNDSIKSLYVDTDGDKLADIKMRFIGTNTLYLDYAMPGDSIMFKIDSEHDRVVYVGNCNNTEKLDSINGLDYWELLWMKDLNKFYRKSGRQKTR